MPGWAQLRDTSSRPYTKHHALKTKGKSTAVSLPSHCKWKNDLSSTVPKKNSLAFVVDSGFKSVLAWDRAWFYLFFFSLKVKRWMKLVSEHFKSWESKPSRAGHSFQGFQALTKGHFVKPQLTRWGRFGKSGCNWSCRGENPLVAVEAECSQLPAPKWLIEFERTVKYHSQSQLSLFKKRGSNSRKINTKNSLFHCRASKNAFKTPWEANLWEY